MTKSTPTVSKQTLLDVQSVSELAVGHHVLPGHIADGFLATVGGKFASTQLRYQTNGPVGAVTATFDDTDDGIMQFLFKPIQKDAKLKILKVSGVQTHLNMLDINFWRLILFCYATEPTIAAVLSRFCFFPIATSWFLA